MNDELQHLKNLGKTSAQWLHAAGIHSASDLRRLGAVGAYQAVKTRGFRASARAQTHRGIGFVSKKEGRERDGRVTAKAPIAGTRKRTGKTFLPDYRKFI